MRPSAHGAALGTILIWGLTFISTKILLQSFTPLDILFTRFLMGFLALYLLYPRPLKLADPRHKGLFAAAGLTGITLYYMLENIALTKTSAANVGVIITVAPFLTALFSAIFLKTEKPRLKFYLGFAIAVTGVALISFSGRGSPELNPLGDLLALAAAVMWAIYSILTRKISDLGHNSIQTTRHIFFYGLVFMLPILGLTGFQPNPARFIDPVNLGNLLFLGFGASALCFVTWSVAVRRLGAVRTSVYIYLVPGVTVMASALILKERVTAPLVIGAALTLIGLWLSETNFFDKTKTVAEPYSL